VQDFMPTPMTLATDMFYSGYHPFTMKPLPVTRDVDAKRMQKALMRWADPELAPFYDRAMQQLGRPERFRHHGGAATERLGRHVPRGPARARRAQGRPR
jgi:radical SAM superfamily enzyme YgiQ (UPF0313 family)